MGKSILIFMTIFGFASCSTVQKADSTTIYPLDPVESVVHMKDPYSGIQSLSIVKYYVVYGNLNDRPYIEKLLSNYAVNHVDSSRLDSNVRFEIWFYKKSKVTTKDYKQEGKDVIDFHSNDRIATYSWNGFDGTFFWDAAFKE